MPFEILHKEIEIALDKITTQIKRLKNGVVADSLKKSGILYEMSYGVSIVHLRKIAAAYTTDNQLAKALWNKKWRETMMLATLLLEKNNSSDFLVRFTSEAKTEELLQQIGMNTLAEFPDATTWIRRFIESGDLNQKVVACYAISRLFTGSNPDSQHANVYTKLLLDSSTIERHNWLEINALAKALSKVGFCSTYTQNEILQFFKQRYTHGKYWQIAYEMVKTEFEYR